MKLKLTSELAPFGIVVCIICTFVMILFGVAFAGAVKCSLVFWFNIPVELLVNGLFASTFFTKEE